MAKPRYITKADSDEYGWVEFYGLLGETGLTVFEPEDSTANTGLVDANGNTIYRVNERRRIGFV